MSGQRAPDRGNTAFSPRRAAEGGLSYHALNRAVARLAIFDGDDDYAAFERVLAQAVARGIDHVAACHYAEELAGDVAAAEVFETAEADTQALQQLDQLGNLDKTVAEADQAEERP